MAFRRMDRTLGGSGSETELGDAGEAEAAATEDAPKVLHMLLEDPAGHLSQEVPESGPFTMTTVQGGLYNSFSANIKRR